MAGIALASTLSLLPIAGTDAAVVGFAEGDVHENRIGVRSARAKERGSIGTAPLG